MAGQLRPENSAREVPIEPDNLGGGEVLSAQEAGISHDQASTRERRVALLRNLMA
jgi:hypothetical protein